MGRVQVGVLASVMLSTAPGARAGDAADLATAATPRVRFEDPRYDDRGPGDYIYPTGLWYRRGMFDLRAFEVVTTDRDVTFRLFLELPVERPDQVMINSNQALPLANEIYFRNIDIFVDFAAGTGQTDGIPGRNVRFRPAEAWDFAVIITPQPDLVRQILRGWPPARQIYVADNVRSRGQEVWVTVPLARVGGVPDADSGYQVVVSGALNRNNFQVFQRVTDAFMVDALTMPVFGVAETQAFGGGDLSRWQPRAIDILTPKGVTQAEVLSHYDHDTRDFAVLPMVYPSGRRPVATTTSSTAGAGAAGRAGDPSPSGAPDVEVRTTAQPDDGYIYTTIREVHDQMAILEARASGIAPYRIGTVVGDQGQELGRVVVNAIYPDFIQATIVQGQDRVERGARVRFDPPKEQEK